MKSIRVLAGWGIVVGSCFGLHASAVNAQEWKTDDRSYSVGAGDTKRLLVADVDGDKSPDTLVVNHSDLWLLLGDHKDGFVPNATKLHSNVHDITAIDPNGGGKLLVIMLADADGGARSALYMLNPNQFRSGVTQDIVELPSNIEVGPECVLDHADIDGHHNEKLIVSCPANAETGKTYIGTFNENGKVTFNLLQGLSVATEAIAAADYDGDNKPDIAYSWRDDKGTQHNSILWGKDDQVKLDAVSFAGADMSKGDVFADGHSGLLISSDASITWFGNSDNTGTMRDRFLVRPTTGCVVQRAVPARVYSDPSVRSQDILIAQMCSGSSTSQIQILRNPYATSLSFRPDVKITDSGFDITLQIEVHPIVGVSVPEGVVAVGINRNIVSTSNLYNGTASLVIHSQGGPVPITVAYKSANGFVRSDRTVTIHLPMRSGELSGSATLPHANVENALLKLARHQGATLVPGAHLLRVGLTTASPGVGSPTITPNNAPIGSNFQITGVVQSTLTSNNCIFPYNCPNGVVPSGTYYVVIDGSVVGQAVPVLNLGPPLECGADDGSGHGTDTCFNPIYVNLSYSTSSIGPGNHNVSFSYVSDGYVYTDSIGQQYQYTNAGSGAAPFIVTGKLTPTLSVSCSPNPITYGPQTSNCSAHVSGGGGTIAFTIDGNPWFTGNVDGAGNVSGGGFNNYPAGNHTIGVTSSGDSTYNGTSSSTVLTINKATPTVTVACSPNPISYGSQSTTCTAHTSGGGGPVTMYWNGLGSLWGSGSFDGGGNFSLSGFNGQPAGNYAVIANSSGDANYNGASGSTVVTINKTTPSVSFSVSPNPITFGLQATTVSVHVGCNTSCGFVDFRYDGAEWTTIPLDGGGNASAATGLGTNPAGDHTFQVNYLGDANNNAVSTAPQIWTILQAPTTTTITSTLTPTKEGQNVSWPCTVTSPGGTPTGTITYTDNGNFVTSSTVPGGVAWGGTGLPVGTHVIGCSFAAQGNFAASSSSVTQVVIPAISSTVTELTTSNNAYPYADSTTLSALVDTGGNAPTGTVTFKSNGVEIGSGNLTSVSATNLIPYSQQVGGTSWSGYCGDSSSIVLNTSDFSAPDGTTTATKFTIPGAPGCGSGGAVGAIDTIAAGLTAGQTYTISVWMRGSKGGEVVGFGLNDNAGGGAALTTSWHRYSVTLQNIPQGVADAGRGFQVVDWTPNDVFYVWGAQVEQSTLVGPYVATYSTPTTGQGGLATLTTLLLPVGNNSIVANYEGDPNDYSSISQPIVVTVIKATPAITWASPSAITYGTALSGTQLNATTRGIPGTFVYTPAAGTVLGAGTQTLSVNFIPDDSVSYNGATATVSLTVNKAAPTLSWATPSAITYGMALSGTQLNATSGGIAGTFVYSPAAGTVLGVGTQTLSVNFIPDDPATYNGATTTLSLTVNKASPTLSWATPSAITYGTALSGAQLNATSGGVAGTFVYSPAAGTVLGAGTQTLGVTFIPTDSANYNGATTTISLTVNKATPTLSWATPSSIIYGTALSGAQLNATSGGLAGTFVYSPASGTVLAAGTQTLSATFSPSDTADYSSQTVTTSLLVTKATPGITLTSTQDPSSYGDRIAFNVQLTGVGGSIPSGSIVLYDGGMLLTTISLDATGKGTYSTANLPANIHNIKGVYSGDTNYQ